MDRDSLEQIVNPLLDWYREHARVLPWRQDRNLIKSSEGGWEEVPDAVPYRVWVSEIMLQQTRVEAVIPYYERFMQYCPDIQSLAQTPEEQLLKLWEGLGYYSRARNLQKTAQIICRDYEGHFPRSYEEILRLPGIGPYTAGAIASIAFEAAEPAVDGNVLRVITRLMEDEGDIQDVQFRRQITDALRAVYPQQERGNFTQSIMELGAVVCVPNGNPKCGECPVCVFCGAYRSGTQLNYPVRKKKRARRIEEKTVLVLWHHGYIALNRRSKEGVLSGMWELPNIEGYCDEAAVTQWLLGHGIALERIEQIPDRKHIFTHIEWHMRCFLVECNVAAEDAEEGLLTEKSDKSPFTWVSPEVLAQEIALPTAFKKVVRNLPIPPEYE